MIFTFLLFLNQAKEWTPAGKAKKENPDKKFYSESEEEEDSSESSSDSGGFLIHWKALFTVAYRLCFLQNSEAQNVIFSQQV